MRIGLYLQDYRFNTIKEFESKMNVVKKQNLDLLVFPETGYTPDNHIFYCNDIESDEERECVRTTALKLSKRIGCAVIIGADDTYGTIYNIYANAHAQGEETETKFYYKHTMTQFSPMEFENYSELIDSYFAPIILKNKRLGMTICYDCNHSAFSRILYKNKVDIIINSTGGNVVYKKWYKYNKVRAIENNCFHLCTMGYCDNNKGNSYTFGFTPNGKLMRNTSLFPITNDLRNLGNIFVYDTDDYANDYDGECDLDINQKQTYNEKGEYKIKISDIDTTLSSASKISENLFVKKVEKYNVVFCVLNEKDIVMPEKALKLLYHPRLKLIPNKKYIIINNWNKEIEKNFYETILSDILKVRSMESFCAVILNSLNIAMVYQCGDNRTSQVIAPQNNFYALDFGRMGGPETIWKNKTGMKACWRNGFELIINRL